MSYRVPGWDWIGSFKKLCEHLTQAIDWIGILVPYDVKEPRFHTQLNSNIVPFATNVKQLFLYILEIFYVQALLCREVRVGNDTGLGVHYSNYYSSTRFIGT